MAKGKAAWGIEVGAYEIKAIRLEDGGETGVEVTDFDVIRHKKVLTTPDLDQNEVIRLSLGQLISQNNLEGENLVMSVPGNAGHRSPQERASCSHYTHARADVAWWYLHAFHRVCRTGSTTCTPCRPS